MHEDITSFSESAFAWHLQPAWKQIFISIRQMKLLFTLLPFSNVRFILVEKHRTGSLTSSMQLESKPVRGDRKCSRARVSGEAVLEMLWGFWFHSINSLQFLSVYLPSLQLPVSSSLLALIFGVEPWNAENQPRKYLTWIKLMLYVSGQHSTAGTA